MDPPPKKKKKIEGESNGDFFVMKKVLSARGRILTVKHSKRP